MKQYQQEYLELLNSVYNITLPSAEDLDPESFIEAVSRAHAESSEAVRCGTALLRENLFPVLDDILSASEDEISSLYEFAGELMSGVDQKDVGLHYSIHLALLSYARHRGLRDMTVRELYLTGMSLYNLETMLSPNAVRLFTTRMRMYFTESASYFDTPEYGGITDPETRGYIHRSLGNIALSYDTSDPESAKAKLAAVTRSINILSDPDVRAKTPSLPWDTYLYKSHQERTSLLSFLRTGHAGPEAFAQVLESAQTVQSRQLRSARERGEMLQPRWQYAYMAARYHCGALILEEYLDALYSMSFSCKDDDFGTQSMFTHLSVPAIYIEYSKQLRGGSYANKVPLAVLSMIKRMMPWLVNAPNGESNEQMMFYIRQFLYTYTEYPGGMPFFEILQDVFAARNPVNYARMWVAGQTAKQLMRWAIEDCPQMLIGLIGCDSTGEVLRRSEELCEFAEKAGRLYDTGMVHFINLEASACRGLFQEEEEIIRLHAHCGAQLLGSHESTKLFADVARGHHCRYDGLGGYPLDFSPSESEVSAMIYLAAVTDAVVSSENEMSSRFHPQRSFEQACEDIEAESGREYAPFAAGLLKSENRRKTLAEELSRWKKEAYLDMYRRRAEIIGN